MKTLIRLSLLSLLTVPILAGGPCKSVACCTPSTCCGVGQFCPIDLTVNDLMQTGLVGFQWGR